MKPFSIFSNVNSSNNWQAVLLRILEREFRFSLLHIVRVTEWPILCTSWTFLYISARQQSREHFLRNTFFKVIRNEVYDEAAWIKIISWPPPRRHFDGRFHQIRIGLTRVQGGFQDISYRGSGEMERTRFLMSELLKIRVFENSGWKFVSNLSLMAPDTLMFQTTIELYRCLSRFQSPLSQKLQPKSSNTALHWLQ